MSEKKYYCLNCEEKMPCIVANLGSDEEVCLKEKEYGDVDD